MRKDGGKYENYEFQNTVRALGIKEAASGAIIGGIVGAISVTLSRRKPLHRAN